MEIVIEIIIMTILVGLGCLIISEGINKQLLKERDYQKKLNKEVLNLYQNKQLEVDTLMAVLRHIKEQLLLLKLKECPPEEYKNIPLEIADWIEKLEQIKGVKDNGVYKQV